MMAHWMRRPATRWQARRPDRHPAALVAVAYAAIGIALIVQPQRFANTPSYQNLIEIISQLGWGVIYLVCALLLVVPLFPLPRRPRWILAVTGHTVSIALTGFWLAAFVLRYFTDSGTTIVNLVSWGAYLALLIRSMLNLTDRTDA